MGPGGKRDKMDKKRDKGARLNYISQVEENLIEPGGFFRAVSSPPASDPGRGNAIPSIDGGRARRGQAARIGLVQRLVPISA